MVQLVLLFNGKNQLANWANWWGLPRVRYNTRLKPPTTFRRCAMANGKSTKTGLLCSFDEKLSTFILIAALMDIHEDNFRTQNFFILYNVEDCICATTLRRTYSPFLAKYFNLFLPYLLLTYEHLNTCILVLFELLASFWQYSFYFGYWTN